MNYIKHLTGFFDRVAHDNQLNPTHVSMYIALFQFWNCNRFKNPISISRDEIMRISKISSKATYHKCLRALHNQGYIKYEPSFNPYKGSQVHVFNFADDLKPLSKADKAATPIFVPVVEQVVNKLCTSSETGTEQVVEQALVPYINNTKITNIKNNSNVANLGKPENKIQKEFNFKNGAEEKEKKLRQKKKAPALREPMSEEVLHYFIQQKFPELEANKFYNYFQSIGWRVGGKTLMTDWHAAAENWMLNAPKFGSTVGAAPKTFDTSAAKNYAEPL